MNQVFSVSQALDLLSCPRKAWSDRDTNVQWLRVPESIAQVLGQVLHKLIEEIDEGLFDGPVQDDSVRSVITRWQVLTDEAHAHLSLQAGFGTVPLPSRWPYFVVKRARATARLVERLARHNKQSLHQHPEIEKFIESVALGLRGRVDRIEFFNDEVKVIDHKSSERPTTGISERYRLQLILYSLLYSDSCGVLPTSAAIEWLGGERDYISIDKNVLGEAKDSFKKARELLKSTSAPKGAPNAEVCAYCQYRPVCDDYISTHRSEWKGQAPFVRGKVVEVLHHSGNLSLNVNVDASSPPELPQATVHQLSTNLPVKIGDYVVADKLNWPRNSNNFDVTWESRVQISNC